MEYPPELLAVLKVYERRYKPDDKKHVDKKAGDKSALFDAVAHCAAHQLPMPEWVRYALVSAHAEKAQLQITDWKDVFGDILPRKAQRQKKESSAKIDLLGGDIVQAVARSRKAKIKVDWDAIAKEVTDAHKERTGEALSLRGGTAKDVYYRTRKRMDKLFGEEGARIIACDPKRGRPR